MSPGKLIEQITPIDRAIQTIDSAHSPGTPSFTDTYVALGFTNLDLSWSMRICAKFRQYETNFQGHHCGQIFNSFDPATDMKNGPDVPRLNTRPIDDILEGFHTEWEFQQRYRWNHPQSSTSYCVFFVVLICVFNLSGIVILRKFSHLDHRFRPALTMRPLTDWVFGICKANEKLVVWKGTQVQILVARFFSLPIWVCPAQIFTANGLTYINMSPRSQMRFDWL